VTTAERELWLDANPDDKLASLRAHAAHVAARIDEVLDWIEADPPDPRAKRRRFSNGMWAVSATIAGDEWIVLWEEDEPNHPVIRFIGESSSI
jgi:hypothetical protein